MPQRYFHICNPNTPEPPGCKNLCSQHELESVREEGESGFLIHVHLNWEGQALSVDRGFDVASHIRTYAKSLLPIIFYSWTQKEYFEYKSKAALKYNLLYGRGSAFLEAPFTSAELTKTIEDVPLLSQSSLHDVVTMLADVKGLVLDKLNHNLKFGCDALRYFEEAEPYLTERQKGLVGFEEYRQKLINLTKENNEHAFWDTKEAFLGICNSILTESGKDVQEPPSQVYKILVVEDVESELKNATHYLEKHFTVVSVKEGEEAINVLNKDLSNEILAVISDWRLYADRSQSYWQKYQGYEVLEAASKTGSRALFALTSQADFVVHHIRNALGFKFTLIKKQNLQSPDKSPEQWHLFSDLLHSGCSGALSLISEMPGSKNWYKSVEGVSYKELYLQKKQSLESSAFFASVVSKADEIWAYLKEESQNRFRNVKQVKNLYGLEIPKNKLNLSTVLVLRLMWLGLWYMLNGESVEKDRDEVKDRLMRVYRIAFSGGYRLAIRGNNANVELNKVCLTINDIQQKRLLPDERAWLFKNGLIK